MKLYATQDSAEDFFERGLDPEDGSAEVKVHQKLLEVLASLKDPDGIFTLSDIDQKYARVNPGNSDSTKLMIVSISYSLKGDHHWYGNNIPGTYLTWNQFVRNGRPTELRVRKQIEISKP